MTASYKQFTLQFNEDKDADVLAYLRSQPSMINAIRKLVRAQIERDAVTAREATDRN